jgi:hypothetical protein
MRWAYSGRADRADTRLTRSWPVVPLIANLVPGAGFTTRWCCPGRQSHAPETGLWRLRLQPTRVLLGTSELFRARATSSSRFSAAGVANWSGLEQLPHHPEAGTARGKADSDGPSCYPSGLQCGIKACISRSGIRTAEPNTVGAGSGPSQRLPLPPTLCGVVRELGFFSPLEYRWISANPVKFVTKLRQKPQALFVLFRPISQCYGSVCMTGATRAPRGSSQAENPQKWCRSGSCTLGLAGRLITTRTFLLIRSSGQRRGLMPSSTRRLGLSDTATSPTHLMGVTETES